MFLQKSPQEQYQHRAAAISNMQSLNDLGAGLSGEVGEVHEEHIRHGHLGGTGRTYLGGWASEDLDFLEHPPPTGVGVVEKTPDITAGTQKTPDIKAGTKPEEMRAEEV